MGLLLLLAGVERNPGPPRPSRPRNEPRRGKAPPPTALKICQLNINGIMGHKALLERLLSERSPDVVLVQESLLHAGVRDPKFAGYDVLRQDRNTRRAGPLCPPLGRAGPATGGLVILIKSGHGISWQQLPRPPNLPARAALEILGIRLFSGAGSLNIYNVYRPPVRGGDADARDGSLHINSWPNGDCTIFGGDFNAHSVEWDNFVAADAHGTAIEDWCDLYGHSVLNDGSATRYSSGGEPSAPDLTLVSQDLVARCDWDVRLDDHVFSDHVPIETIIRDGKSESARAKPGFARRKTNWPEYKNIVEAGVANINVSDFKSIDKACNFFTQVVCSAYTQTTPYGARLHHKPFWSPACAEARRKARRAFAKLRHRRTRKAEDDYRTAVDRAKAIIGQEKRAAWESFAGSLSAIHKPTRLWSTIRALEGRTRGLPNCPLKQGDKLAASDADKATTFLSTIADVSRFSVPRDIASNCSITTRRHIEANRHADASRPFSRAELRFAIDGAKGRAAGPDKIFPEALKELPPGGFDFLHALLNRAWAEARWPAAWRAATLIPIFKGKGKDPSAPKSYRPVALLSNVGKLPESMIKRRLSHWAERYSVIPSEQGGFRAGRCPEDSVLRIVQPCFDAFCHPKPAPRAILVSLDLEGCFDRVSRRHCVAALARADFPSHWVRVVNNWLRDRRARATWNGQLSKPRVLTEGLPQGSPCSPILMAIAYADLPGRVKAAVPEAQVVQFADDCNILVIGKPGEALDDLAKRAQKAVSAAVAWADDAFAKIAPTKTAGLFLTTNTHEANHVPNISVQGERVKFEREIKILGIILDQQLRMGRQADKAGDKFAASLKPLRALAGTSWGANSKLLRQCTRSLASSRAFYGIGAWGPFVSASNTTRLERQLNRAARLVTGAPMSTPTKPLRREAGIPPLRSLIDKDSAKLLSNAMRFPPSHCLSTITAPPPWPNRLKAGEAKRGNWRERAEHVLAEVLPPGERPQPWPPPNATIPPWESGEFHHLLFSEVAADTNRQDQPAARLAAAYRDLQGLAALDRPAIKIWSDGSAVDGVRDGVGGVHIDWGDGSAPTDTFKTAGTSASSTLAEAVGAALGLQLVESHLRGPGAGRSRLNIWLLFDSRTLHQRLQRDWSQFQDANEIEISHRLAWLCRAGHKIRIIRVPGHCGLSGNERADRAAAAGAGAAQRSFGVTRSALSASLNRRAESEWRDITILDNHGEYIGLTQGESVNLGGLSRAEAVAIHGLRLNRFRPLAYTQHKAGQARSPRCTRCGQGWETSSHFIYHCRRWEAERRAELGARPSPRLLAEPDGIKQVVKYCRRCGLL